MGWLANILRTKSEGVQTYCVPNSILCAWTWGALKRGQVRIAVQKIGDGVDHSQAQAFINDVWTPLTEIWTGSYMKIVPWKQHYPQESYRYLTLKDWIDEQIQYTNQGG